MFFISTLNENDEYGSRCVGFTNNLKDAFVIVLRNVNDIHEQTYKYAVIEEINEPGLYPDVESEKWFEWTGDKYYPLIDKPKQFKNYGNFAIG